MGSTRCRCGGVYFRVFRVSLLVVLCVEVFALAALFVLAGRVLACEPGSGEEIVLEKNQPAGAETYLDTSWFPGVDQGQGFFWSRAVPVQEAAALLDRGFGHTLERPSAG